MTRTNYDPEADVRFGRAGAAYDSAAEVASGVYVEFDADGAPIGVEITRAQRCSALPGARTTAAA